MDSDEVEWGVEVIENHACRLWTLLWDLYCPWSPVALMVGALVDDDQVEWVVTEVVVLVDQDQVAWDILVVWDILVAWAAWDILVAVGEVADIHQVYLENPLIGADVLQDIAVEWSHRI